MVWNLLGLFASIVVPGVILGLGAYFTQKLFNLQIASDYTITSKIGEPVCLTAPLCRVLCAGFVTVTSPPFPNRDIPVMVVCYPAL